MKNNFNIQTLNYKKLTENGECIIPLILPFKKSEWSALKPLLQGAFESIGKLIYFTNAKIEEGAEEYLFTNSCFSAHLFARHGFKQLSKYPQIRRSCSRYFNISLNSKNTLGAYEYLQENPLVTPSSLFSISSGNDAPFYYRGHFVKKAGDTFILDYHVPYMEERFSACDRMVVALIRHKGEMEFSKINHIIYETIQSAMPEVLNEQNGPWYARAALMYHISHNHIETMFDISEHVMVQNRFVDFAETPLGSYIIDKELVSLKELNDYMKYFKKFPLTNLYEKKRKNLINLRCAGIYEEDGNIDDPAIEECASILTKLIK
jgi:hypothetical protein